MHEVISLYFADGATKVDEQKDDEVQLTWKVVLRTGTWKLRPGPGGTKVRKPLRVYRDKAPKGHISMSELVKNFDAGAIEFVTVPILHSDGTLENTGYVRKLAIQDVSGEDGSKEKQALLWAGFEFTEPDVAGKVERGTIPAVSAGVMFDYEATEGGEKYSQVLAHVMLTNKPWIGKTGKFTTKPPEGVMASEISGEEIIVEELQFDTNPPTSRFRLDLEAYDDGESDPAKKDPAPSGSVVWKPEEGYQFARGRVQKALEDWRRSLLSQRQLGVTYEDFPYYHVEDVARFDAQSGKALICSGYGNEKEAWVASFKFDTEGYAEIEPFMNWTTARQEWVAASEQQQPSSAPAAGRPPAPADHGSSYTGDALRVAQQRRVEQVDLGESQQSPGGTMPKISELLAGVELSQEQRDEILAEEKRNDEYRRKYEDSVRASRKAEAKAYADKLDDVGLGDPGLKAYIYNVLLSDDGEPALNFSEETESGQRTQPIHLTASEIVKKFIDALPTDKESGRVALSEQAKKLPNDEKPPEDEDDTKPKDGKAGSDALLAEFEAQGLDIGLATSTAGGQ